MMSARRRRRMTRDEAESDSIMKTIMDLNLLVQAQTKMSAIRNKTKYERQLKEAKMKLIAQDAMIRKVRAGELNINDVRDEVRGTKQENKRRTKNLIMQLEMIPNVTPPEPLDSNVLFPDDIPEDQKKILLWNKKKQIDTLQKESRLLMDVVFGKKMKGEHHQLIRKEYHKMLKPVPKYNIHL